MLKNRGGGGGGKSTRKPLREISSNARVVKPSSSSSSSCSNNNNNNNNNNSNNNNDSLPQDHVAAADDCLDTLLHVHSDLSSLIHQIDGIVRKTLKLNVTKRKERKEIESFAQVLTEMQASLKTWVPRFQKAFASPMGSEDQPDEQLFSNRPVDSKNDDMEKIADSPDREILDSLVSPSPLVSWRPGCFNEDGRQLFLLTPLPRLKAFSSRLKGSCKSGFEHSGTNTNVRPPQSCCVSPGDIHNVIHEGIAAEQTPVRISNFCVSNLEASQCGFISPEKVPKMDRSKVAMTPCLEVSPPKSCVLLEPVSEFTNKKSVVVRAATPFPIVHNFDSTDDSDSSSSEASKHLILKYPELVGIRQTCDLGNIRKMVEASPNWFMSPPKTCVLMEPPDEKLATCSGRQLPRTGNTPSWKTKKETEFEGVQTVAKKSYNQGFGDSSTVVERTPMWKPGSNAQTGKHPGENTLKKELWTMFEAASTQASRFKVSSLQGTVDNAHNKFLELLEET